MTWWIAPAVGLVSSLLSKKDKQPTYTPPPQATLPQVPQYDLGQSDLYKSLVSSLGSYNKGGAALPPEYLAALRNAAQLEATTGYNQAEGLLSQSYGRQRRQSVEEMNKLGLLKSGALGIRQGLFDEEQARQTGNLASQYQSTMANLNASLMQQELAERDRIRQLLAQIESERARASQSGNETAARLASENAFRQYQSGLGQWEQQTRNRSDAIGWLGEFANQYFNRGK